MRDEHYSPCSRLSPFETGPYERVTARTGPSRSLEAAERASGHILNAGAAALAVSFHANRKAPDSHDGRTVLLATGEAAATPHAQPGEPVWTLTKAPKHLDCELRDDGELGCEVQLLRDGEFDKGRRFATRARALAHATAMRALLEGEGGWTRIGEGVTG